MRRYLCNELGWKLKIEFRSSHCTAMLNGNSGKAKRGLSTGRIRFPIGFIFVFRISTSDFMRACLFPCVAVSNSHKMLCFHDRAGFVNNFGITEVNSC